MLAFELKKGIILNLAIKNNKNNYQNKFNI